MGPHRLATGRRATCTPTRRAPPPSASGRSTRGAPVSAGRDRHSGTAARLTVDDGLVWLRHRTYHPATRSFLQTDPWPPVAGTAVAANPYHYAGNDPVNAQDPFGLRPVTDNVVTRGLDGVGDWLGNNWEYLAGGAWCAGIALTATGVGGASASH